MSVYQSSGFDHAPYLEQNLWTHTEEAVHYPKRENHRHAIDVPDLLWSIKA